MAHVIAQLGETSYHRVRDAIRSDIVSGVFAQGQRLKLAALTVRYGLSPAPIREALNQLEAEGLIIIRPNRGAQVRPIDQAFIQEIFEIRIGLEPFLVAKCVSVAAARHVSGLEAIHAEFLAAAAQLDRLGLIRINAQFHNAVYEIRPNTEALRLLGRHSAVMSTIRHRYGFADARIGEMVEEHAELLQACKDRDGERAGRVQRRHIEHSLDDMLRQVLPDVSPQSNGRPT